MRHESPSAFSAVQVRYIVFVWLLLAFYVPGAAFVLSQFENEWTWYWWEIAYLYLSHAFLALTIVIVGVLLGKLPVKACVGRQPTRAELLGGLELTAFLFVASIAALYATHYPLSFVAPGFVEWWYINTADVIYSDGVSYPILPNLLGLLSLCVVTPVLEEIAFRGMILPRWTRKWGLRAGIVGSSAVFAVVHSDPIGAFLFGVGMCVLYLKTHSLILPIVCHASNNLVVWLLELWHRIGQGPEYVYTLQEFQSEWIWGVICGVVGAFWVALYFKRPKSSVPWTLPVT